jgi:hypothetical protein
MRPHWVSPVRSVPDHIQKPEYAITGINRLFVPCMTCDRYLMSE